MERAPRTSHAREADPASFFGRHSSSFVDLVSDLRPELLPRVRGDELTAEGVGKLPHGTTIVAATFSGGVVIAGDRRGTMGSMIAQRDLEKILIVDEFSAAGFAGTAGLGVEALRLFAVELEHYEKLEGNPLTFDGKANKLASMVRGNLGAAMQGMSYVPLLAGFDVDAADPARAGRIVSYDVVGSRADETGYAAVGSGSIFARSAMKKLHDPQGDQDATVRALLQSLFDAADEDTATGGLDTLRDIHPMVVPITAEGARRMGTDEVRVIAEEIVAGRRARPGGG